MEDVTEKIEAITEEVLRKREDLFVIEVKVTGNPGNQKVIILIDGDEGVKIDDCSNISRELSEILDQKNILEYKYTLEVSSPGLDFPLKFIRQYKKNLGRKVKVKLKEGKVVKGELLDVSENEITIKEDKKSKKQKQSGEEAIIPLDDVEKTNVLVTF